jgi:hypothetical protein
MTQDDENQINTNKIELKAFEVADKMKNDKNRSKKGVKKQSQHKKIKYCEKCKKGGGENDNDGELLVCKLCDDSFHSTCLVININSFCFFGNVGI